MDLPASTAEATDSATLGRPNERNLAASNRLKAEHKKLSELFDFDADL
jgi:hypothetical protein